MKHTSFPIKHWNCYSPTFKQTPVQVHFLITSILGFVQSIVAQYIIFSKFRMSKMKKHVIKCVCYVCLFLSIYLLFCFIYLFKAKWWIFKWVFVKQKNHKWKISFHKISFKSSSTKRLWTASHNISLLSRCSIKIWLNIKISYAEWSE